MAQDIAIPVAVDPEFVRQELERMVDAGEIKIELCGHREHVDGIKGFTLDKRKYRMRFAEETEDYIRVIIEPKE